jgi:hypothetical protein
VPPLVERVGGGCGRACLPVPDHEDSGALGGSPGSVQRGYLCR